MTRRRAVEVSHRASIQAFVGPNGSGKTYGAVKALVVPAWEAGQVVWSNLALYPGRLGFSESLFCRLESWRQLATVRDAVLLLDEISSVLPSRQASTVPPDLMRRLNQLRKAQCVVGWTAPAWARCDLALREVTQSVTVCASRFPDQWVRESGSATVLRPFGRRVRSVGGGFLRSPAGWEPRRLLTMVTYDANAYDGEFSAGAVRAVRPRRVVHTWRPASRVEEAYGTLEEVGLLDHLNDSGQCLACGGMRSRKSCSCSVSV